ncbi:hypothetical protein ACIQM4_17785 [Streptomyces sp. NPDC091272]|uniref:hypothetical protein n=1 Tax=Streptomyces sp. NPDC091272 TaxID=3365981 RepID=UPI003816A154
MHDSPPASHLEPELGFDWESERRWWDSGWAASAMVIAVAAALVGVWVWMYGGFVLWVAGACAVIMAACAPWGVRLGRKVAAEAGAPARSLPVLNRRLRDGRIPDGPQARAAMLMLGRRYLRTARHNRWTYPVVITAQLLNAVTQGLQGHWWPSCAWLGVAVFFAITGLLLRRTSARISRTVARLEEPRAQMPGM